MPHDFSALVAQFRETLTQQRYNPVVVHNYCRNADYFLCYLMEREIALKAVTPTEVSNYLRFAVRRFHKSHGYPPAPHWPFQDQPSMHCCGSCKNSGRLSLMQLTLAKFFAGRYARSTRSG